MQAALGMQDKHILKVLFIFWEDYPFTFTASDFQQEKTGRIHLTGATFRGLSFSLMLTEANAPQ